MSIRTPVTEAAAEIHQGLLDRGHEAFTDVWGDGFGGACSATVWSDRYGILITPPEDSDGDLQFKMIADNGKVLSHPATRYIALHQLLGRPLAA